MFRKTYSNSLFYPRFSFVLINSVTLRRNTDRTEFHKLRVSSRFLLDEKHDIALHDTLKFSRFWGERLERGTGCICWKRASIVSIERRGETRLNDVRATASPIRSIFFYLSLSLSIPLCFTGSSAFRRAFLPTTYLLYAYSLSLSLSLDSRRSPSSSIVRSNGR